MSKVVVSPDGFAAALTEIVSKPSATVEKGFKQAVRKACKEARRTAKREAPVGTGKDHRVGHYAPTLGYRVKGAGAEAYGEVGSKKLPGMVHLLEKGHATLAGRHVAGKPHMVKGFDRARPQFERDAIALVEEGLR